jgi:hypothetical protein
MCGEKSIAPRGDLMCNDELFEECVMLIHGPVHFSLQVKGQYFTLDFTSTMSNKPCPPGEYTSDDLGIEGPPTMAPLNADGTESLSKSTGLLLSLLAFFAIIVP